MRNLFKLKQCYKFYITRLSDICVTKTKFITWSPKILSNLHSYWNSARNVLCFKVIMPFFFQNKKFLSQGNGRINNILQFKSVYWIFNRIKLSCKVRTENRLQENNNPSSTFGSAKITEKTTENPTNKTLFRRTFRQFVYNYFTDKTCFL